MALFTIGDLHLSFGTDKPMDVFSGWADYEQRLAANWNRLVSPSDTVVIPGDVSWAIDFQQAVKDFAYIHALNGNKIILKGNHDYWWQTMSKNNRFLADNGFSSIHFLHNNCYVAENRCLCGTRGWFYGEDSHEDKKILDREAGRLTASLEAGKKTGLEPIVFLHYPPVYANNECTEIMTVLRQYGVARCYYGHVHGTAVKTAFSGCYSDIRMQLVSADYLGFTPLYVD